MTASQNEYTSADELRRAFDDSFASALTSTVEPQVELLTFSLGGSAHAARLTEISGVVSARKVTSIPSRTRGLRGLSSAQGRLVLVFDLGMLLGGSSPDKAQRWFLLCGTDQPLAFAVGDIERYSRVPEAALHVYDSRSAPRQFVRDVVDTEYGARPIVDLKHITTTLRKQREPREEDHRL